MANPLLNKLRGNDKKGLFTRTQTAIGYPTGFSTLDYRNGYNVEVRDIDDQLITKYPSIGLVGGSFITIVGKSGTAKTTGAIQMASNIVRKFKNSFVQHYDLEQALTYTRIRNLNGMSVSQMEDKYILKQESTYIEDIFESVMSVAEEKVNNRKDYEYDTGLRDEFNKPIIALEPTVMILDSIPTVASKDTKSEMEGGTYANRVAKALSQFYKRLTPIIKSANIIFIAINHINAKMEINAFTKTQPQLIYMKMDESLPGGNAPIYYAHNLFKFVTAGKCTTEKEGFDGFKVRCEFLKSRTNKAGQFTHLVYNQEYGFDPILSQYEFADENNLVEGRNPYRYFTGYENSKFDARKFRKAFLKNEEVRFALFDKTIPLLEDQLSSGNQNEDDTKIMEEHMKILERLIESQETSGEFDPVA